MVVFYPDRTYLKIGVETAYADGGTPATTIGFVTGFNPTLKNNLIPIREIGGGRNVSTFVYGNFDINGNVDVQVTNDTLDFMKYLIGPRSGSGTTAAPYEIVEADRVGATASDIRTVGIEVGSEAGTTDDVDWYKGVHLISATFTAAQSAVLTATINWVAKTMASTTSAGSYTAPTLMPYVFQSGSFKWGTTPTAVALVTSFAVTMNNNSLIYRVLGDRFIQQPETTIRTYDFTLTVKMSDAIATTLRDDFYGQANSPVSGTSSTSPLDSGTTPNREIELLFNRGTNDQAQILLNDCVIEDMSKPVAVGNEIVEVTFTGFARSGGRTADALTPIRWWTSA